MVSFAINCFTYNIIPIIKGLINDETTLFQYVHAVITMVLICLEMSIMTSGILIGTICFCIREEFKFVNNELNSHIKSSEISKPNQFSNWRKYHEEIADVVQESNENMKLYMGIYLLSFCLLIMVTLYHSTIICTDLLVITMWTLQFTLSLLFLLLPVVAVCNQVLNFHHSFKYFYINILHLLT